MRMARPQPGSLVVTKNEGTVFLDGTSQEGSELISLERLLPLVEVVNRVQFVVANKFVKSAMNLIGTRFQHDVDGRSSASELGAHGIFFSLEFLDGVRRRQHDHATQSELVVVDAIQQEVVVRDP